METDSKVNVEFETLVGEHLLDAVDEYSTKVKRMSNAEYLLGIFWKAADMDAAFAKYLYQQTKERIESGRSMDCDEYRVLLSLASR